VLLVATLVCLLVVVSIVVSMVRNALLFRRELLVERDHRQADVLLMAGATRAVTLLQENTNFRGDVWELPAALIVGHGNGRVRTDITPLTEGRGWDVKVVAEYPLGRDFPVRRTHTFHVAYAQPKK
jgi:hypothetical protein